MLEEWTVAEQCTLGNRVSVSGQASIFEGTAAGIDSEGRLVVRLDDGTERTVAAGDVTILKSYKAPQVKV